MLNYILLTFGFFCSFFVVGFTFVEIFFPKITFRIKFPLYFILSILVSTYLIYLVGLVFGFTKISVLTTFLILIPIYIYKFVPSIPKFKKYIGENKRILLTAIMVFFVYLLALNPAILSRRDNYMVMSGPNWQDTAMHLSITQSLTQGNFPPMAPYFSGQPLSYYYFADFHSSIISILSDEFFPKIFTLSNSILAFVLIITIYMLAFEITKNKVVSMQSAFMGTFFSSFHFVNFLKDLQKGSKITELLYNKSYSMEYDQLFGMANMADYYLQNRPMMVGIPSFIVVTTLIIYAFKNKNWQSIFLSGLIVGMLVKFQFFTVLACLISFGIVTLLNLRRENIIFIFKNIFLFFVPILSFYLIFGLKDVNNQSFIELFKNNFHFGFWDLEKTNLWHTKFLFLNLGLPFVLTFLSLIFSKNKKIRLISFVSLFFVSIPYLISFTPMEGDMLKFFYFAVILFSIASISFLHQLVKNKLMINALVLVVVTFSTLSSFLTLGNSYLNKNYGYSLDAYTAGIWIRENTPKGAVFVTMPTVHSAPTDIGGRLRVISYINWPYSHGFNVGEDNVFIRSDDVSTVYKTGDVDLVRKKYNAKYLYLGDEERGEFPLAEEKLDNNSSLSKIYNQGTISIYEIR